MLPQRFFSNIPPEKVDHQLCDSEMRRVKTPQLETRFSELLGVLSTRFARISHNEIESEVGGWLEKICHSLGFDRGVLAEYLAEKRDFYTTFRWNREGFPQAPGPLAPASNYLPWVSATGALGEIVVVPSIAELPKEAEQDRNFMMQFGMKSILGVPLIVGGRLIAGIAFEDFQAERRWTPTLLARLKLASEILATALERKRSAIESAKLRDDAENIGRLALLGEMAAAIAHELSHPLGAILANAQAARRLLERRHLSLSELKEALDDVITAERRAATYVAKVRTIFRRSELHKE
ncbi:MAG TPA: GAF domain-containing protein, partial [Candidatus Binataceae bacterium]|nr:GAF domain-containing protein [Candidatus Binataceae bacterium]